MDHRAAGDALYEDFRRGVIELCTEFRHLFVAKSRGLRTIKLLCTGLVCEDGRELLNGLDALSLVCAEHDKRLTHDTEEEYMYRREGFQKTNPLFLIEYDRFRKSFVSMMCHYRGYRPEWYKTPPGLISALYLDYRLKYCTIKCALFEQMAIGLIETTSFRTYEIWMPWICGDRRCAHCQKTTGKMKLCMLCENAWHCSKKCRKKNWLSHQNYCKPSNGQMTRETPVQRQLRGC